MGRSPMGRNGIPGVSTLAKFMPTHSFEWGSHGKQSLLGDAPLEHFVASVLIKQGNVQLTKWKLQEEL